MKRMYLFPVILVLTAGVGRFDAPSPGYAQTGIVFEDDMENGLNGWTAEGLWHQETRRYSSATTSWAYNTGHPKYNYETKKERNSGGLTSPIINLGESATLEFMYWYHTENPLVYSDQRRIQIGIVEDGQGATVFTDIAQLHGDMMLQWNSYTLDLSAWANQPVQLRFFFDTMDKMLNNYGGWYIDDVVILDQGSDHEPPTPNPPVWDVWPRAKNGVSIEMSVFPCFDPSGVEYDFFCMSEGCHDSGPQEDPYYLDVDLQPNTEYTYMVIVRDKSAVANETIASQWKSETTTDCIPVPVHVESITTGTVRAGRGMNYGQVEVTVLDHCGEPVSGVEVLGVFSGSYSDEASGTTDASGVAVLVTETEAKKPVYTFCVEEVVHDDWDEDAPCESY